MKIFIGTSVFIRARTFAVAMVSYFKVRASKGAYNFVIHVCGYLASSLFLA